MGLDMESLLPLPMSFRNCAHKLPLIRADHLGPHQIIVQDLLNHLLRALALGCPQLLAGSRKRCFGWPIGHRPHNTLRSSDTFRRSVDAITISGDNAEIELSLVLFRDWKTENVL